MGGLVALDMVLSITFSKILILVNSIYPTRVADALLAKAKQAMVMLQTLLLNMAFIRRLLGLKNAFSEGDDLVMLNDLEACNNYQLDLNELKNLEFLFQ